MKVLLVDDDADLLDVTAYALRREGFHIITATDGEIAFARFEAARPDVVVLDVGLPRRSGLEVCRAIRDAGRTPVILLTAFGQEEDIVRGFRVGADDYVVKPFSPRLLALRIRAVASRGGTIGVIYERNFLARDPARQTLERIIDHLAHLIAIGGEDCASLGSDYDGMISLPHDFKDITWQPVLVERMLKRSWSVERIQKILAGNFLRVVNEVRPD